MLVFTRFGGVDDALAQGLDTFQLGTRRAVPLARRMLERGALY